MNSMLARYDGAVPCKHMTVRRNLHKLRMYRPIIRDTWVGLMVQVRSATSDVLLIQ